MLETEHHQKLLNDCMYLLERRNDFEKVASNEKEMLDKATSLFIGPDIPKNDRSNVLCTHPLASTMFDHVKLNKRDAKASDKA